MLPEQGEQILNICRGHWAANVLFAAVDLGIFDVLAVQRAETAGEMQRPGAQAFPESDGVKNPAVRNWPSCLPWAFPKDAGAENAGMHNVRNRHVSGAEAEALWWGKGLSQDLSGRQDNDPASSGLTAVEVAAAVNADPVATTRLLDALASLGLLIKQGVRYINSPAAGCFLVRGRESYLGHAVHHYANLAEGWSRLGEAVRTGRAVGFDAVEREPYERRLRDYILAMRDNASLKARTLAGHIDAGNYRYMLDLGGGPGSFTIALLKQNPKLKATIFDLAPTLKITRELVKAAGLAARVSLHPGDFTRDELGEGDYDLILAANVVHIYDDCTNRKLVAQAYRALRSGGRLVIYDYVLAAVPAPEAALFDLNMLVGTVCGRVYPIEEMAAWLKEAGFVDAAYIPLTTGSGLLTGRKV